MFDHKKLQDFTDKYLVWVKEKPVSTLSEKEVQQSYAIIIEILGYHNWLYYVKSKPIIADGQYDMLYRYLVDIESAYPAIVRSDSPTQRLINQTQDFFSQAKHTVPLLSLENSYNAQDLADWDNSTQKLLLKSSLVSSEGENTKEAEDISENIQEEISTEIMTEEVEEDSLSLDEEDYEEEYKEGDNNMNEDSKEYLLETDNPDTTIKASTVFPIPYTFLCQPKYDGISIELVYEHGSLLQAITRGDGYIGEDVTANIRTLFSVPTILKAGKDIEHLRIRGEIVMSKKALERLNTERAAIGETLFANVRNAASGSLRQLDTSITAKRGLTCYVYEILTYQHKDGGNFTTDIEAGQWLISQGFLMHQRSKHVTTIDEVIDICDSVTTKNYFDAEDIEFDGVVVKINELELRNILGATNHHPRWAMAYKFPTKQVVTRIVSVDYQVGRTGVITPTANLEPVELGGVTISRASLHNFDYIQEKGICIRDRVWLQRSGEVIPYVVATIPERRDGSEIAIDIPHTCPICGGTIEKGKSDIYVYCTNSACPAKIKGQILYFASRDCLNIEGLGDAFVDLLLEQKLISSIADLYTLDDTQKRLQILANAGIGQKKYFELIEEIKKSKSAPLWRLINGLGINNIGKKIAQIITDAISDQLSDKQKEEFTIYTLEDFLCNQEFLMNIKGIGPEIVQSISNRFQNPVHKAMLELMADRGVSWNIFDTKNMIKGKLTGIRFAITGTFELPRKIIQDILIKHGAIISDSLTQQTNYLLVGEDSSSKVTKAQQLNIPLIEGLNRLEQKFAFLKTDIGSMQLFAKETKKVDLPKQEGLFG